MSPEEATQRQGQELMLDTPSLEAGRSLRDPSLSICAFKRVVVPAHKDEGTEA